RFGAFENSGDVNSGLTISIRKAGCVAQETSIGGELTLEIDSRQCISLSQRDQLCTPAEEQWFVGNDERSNLLFREGHEGGIEIGLVASVCDKNSQAERECSRLNIFRFGF